MAITFSTLEVDFDCLRLYGENFHAAYSALLRNMGRMTAAFLLEVVIAVLKSRCAHRLGAALRQFETHFRCSLQAVETNKTKFACNCLRLQGENFHAAYSALLRDTGCMTAAELVQKHRGAYLVSCHENFNNRT